jgi:hypothetical protein
MVVLGALNLLIIFQDWMIFLTKKRNKHRSVNIMWINCFLFIKIFRTLDHNLNYPKILPIFGQNIYSHVSSKIMAISEQVVQACQTQTTSGAANATKTDKRADKVFKKS